MNLAAHAFFQQALSRALEEGFILSRRQIQNKREEENCIQMKSGREGRLGDTPNTHIETQ